MIALGLTALLALAEPGQEPPAAPPTAAVPESPARLTIRDAEAIARRNNPRITIAQLNAKSMQEATRETKSAYYPNLLANLTGVVAHEGGRITAGGLNNPVVYDRAAGGLALGQLVTDFGRTSNLVASSELHAQAEDERALATRPRSSWRPTRPSTARSRARRWSGWRGKRSSLGGTWPTRSARSPRASSSPTSTRASPS